MAIAGILVLLTVLPILDVIVVSILFGFMLVPVRRKLDLYTRNKVLSSLMIISVIGILSLLLIVYSTTILVGIVSKLVTETFDLGEMLVNMGLERFEPHITQAIASLAATLLASSNKIVTQIGLAIVKMLMFFFITYYVIKEGESITEIVKKSVDKLAGAKRVKVSKFIHIFGEMVRSFFLEYILISIIIGILAFIGFFLINTPYAALFAIITGILAFLPILASFMIFVPIGIWKFAINEFWAGVFILAYGFIVLTIFPTFYLAPVLTSRKAKIHPVLVLIALVAGPLAFGPMGFFYGPIILAFGQSLYTYYIKQKLHEI